MQSSLADVVAQLAPGQVSEPLATKGGWRIVRLVARDEGKVQPFDEVKADLRTRLTTQRTEEQMERVTKKLREHAIIQDMVREVPLQVAPSEGGGRPSLMDAVTSGNPEALTSPSATPRKEGEDEFVTKKGEVKKVPPPSSPSSEATPAHP
jgi:hypothetical protein